MKKILLLAALTIGAAAQFVSAQVNGSAAKPLVSTVDKPVYYYIESAANGTVVLKAGETNNYLGNLVYAPTATNGTMIKHDLKATITGAAISIDNAIWQLVNEGGIVKLKNKGTGLYLDEARWGRTTVTSPFSAEALNTQYTANSQYRLRNSNQASPAVAWYTTANGNYLDRWGSTAPNSQVAWFFIVVPGSEANYEELLSLGVKADLAAKITATQAVLTNTSEGTNIGQFSAGARTTLTNEITTAQGVYDNSSSTSANYITSIANLEAAKWAYLATAVTPVISNESTTKWYLIQGLRPANTYITSGGIGATVTGTTLVPNDAQYWKFVANTNGTADGITLVNKATGEYINADLANNTNIATVAAMPVKNLRLIPSDIFTNGTARFWIENTGSTLSFRLHAGNSATMNWYGNAYDNSSWLITEYITLLKSTLQTAITSAQTMLVNTVDGSEFGQYSGTGRSALSSAIATAQAVFADGTKTEQEVIDATTALNTAITNYKATCNTNVNSLLSTTQGMYRWYWIRNTATHAYAVGKVMSQGTRAVGAQFTYEAKVTNPKPNPVQLFRFETTIDGKIANIVNGLGNVIASNGYIATTPTAENTFALNLLSDGISFNIKPASLNALHAQESGSHIVNWAGDAGTASAWVFDYAMETTVADATALNQTEKSEYRISTVNRTITVEGVNNFEVYSVTGQKQNRERALQSGVYFVKIGDFTQKVMVK